MTQPCKSTQREVTRVLRPAHVQRCLRSAEIRANLVQRCLRLAKIRAALVRKRAGGPRFAGERYLRCGAGLNMLSQRLVITPPEPLHPYQEAASSGERELTSAGKPLKPLKPLKIEERKGDVERVQA
eukprot:3271499-Rhodomonas_salina.1